MRIEEYIPGKSLNISYWRLVWKWASVQTGTAFIILDFPKLVLGNVDVILGAEVDIFRYLSTVKVSVGIINLHILKSYYDSE